MNRIKKIGLSLMSVLCLFAMTPCAFATSANDDVTIDVDVTATISLTCGGGTTPVTVTMEAIAGQGFSTHTATQNSTTCTVITNNTLGYDLEWQATAANLVSGSDTIIPITTSGTPAVWPTISATNGWGGKVGTTTTEDYNSTTWGTGDNYDANGKWVQVPTSSTKFTEKNTATDGDGHITRIMFGAEVGETNITPTGTYTQTVTITAVAGT